MQSSFPRFFSCERCRVYNIFVGPKIGRYIQQLSAHYYSFVYLLKVGSFISLTKIVTSLPQTPPISLLPRQPREHYRIHTFYYLYPLFKSQFSLYRFQVTDLHCSNPICVVILVCVTSVRDTKTQCEADLYAYRYTIVLY